MFIARPVMRVWKAEMLLSLYAWLWIGALVAFCAVAVMIGHAKQAFDAASHQREVAAQQRKRDELAAQAAQAAEARKRQFETFLATVEGDPRRLPMRANLTLAQRRECERVWLTPSGRTIRTSAGTVTGFPNEITVGTPHPPECY